MHQRIRFFICCIFIFSGNIVYSQDSTYDIILQKIKNKIKITTSLQYYFGGLDIDKSIRNPEIADGKIDDPYKTLVHCFLFVADGKLDSNYIRPKGFIGIYRMDLDSLIWCSEPVGGIIDIGPDQIREVREINNDKKVEIITAGASGSLGQNEQLWVFAWNGKTGKLISRENKNGTSEIFALSEPDYSIVDKDGDGIYEICGKDYDAHGNIIDVTYSWNGSLYGNWGKTSKYFHRSKNK
jgi:hypothetical protein